MVPIPHDAVSVDGLNLIALAEEAFLGVLAILAIAAFHGFFITRILFRTERANYAHLSAKRLRRVVVRFYLSILALVLVHLAEIFLWALTLVFSRQAENVANALLLAGSMYTTVGFESEQMTSEWKFFPVFISVSGLFNFAWSTTTMMTLLNQAQGAFRRVRIF